jgi:hypothetical protein
MVGGKCLGRWFEASLRPDGNVGWLVLVALRG